jgi:uncharacterized protein (TIGR02453 family)
MPHFTTGFFKFFDQLGKNNNKVWFDANRKTYEKEVKEPFKKFVTHIIAELAKEQPDILKDAAKSIFRINRDIRFAKDKSPYKNHTGAFFSRSGTKDVRPGYYLHLGAKEIFVGGGVYELDKEKLEKIRQEIYYNNDAFKKIITEKNFKAYYGPIKGDQNKILAPDYKEFAKEQPLIANKQFYYTAQLKKEDVLADDFDKTVLKYFKAAAKFNSFMMRAMIE